MSGSHCDSTIGRSASDILHVLDEEADVVYELVEFDLVANGPGGSSAETQRPMSNLGGV